MIIHSLDPTETQPSVFRSRDRLAGHDRRLEVGGWSNCAQAESGDIWCWGYRAGGSHGRRLRPADAFTGRWIGRGGVAAGILSNLAWTRLCSP